MQKIINSKKYDSENAEEIAHFSNSYGRNDFEYMAETLYRTSKGNWFIIGEGGPRTKYATPVSGGGMSGSEDLLAFNNRDAYKWLAKHNEVEAIERYFNDRIVEA